MRETYRMNHERQTLEFVRGKKAEYGALDRAQMSVWEAMDRLAELVDESDPDLDLPQPVHALQTAEGIRADGHPDWMVLVGLIHDLGKVLCLFGEPQWAVVGDTFPVGCAFSDRVVHADLFARNPDASDPRLRSDDGIYDRHCGLDRVHMSWGHDEYLYLVLREHLPDEALYVIRYHSFYACHSAGAYQHLLAPRDHELMKWVRAFQPYDLYTKAPELPDAEAVRPFYERLVAAHLPSKLRW